jgi:hypothetical protein
MRLTYIAWRTLVIVDCTLHRLSLPLFTPQLLTGTEFHPQWLVVIDLPHIESLLLFVVGRCGDIS